MTILEQLNSPVMYLICGGIVFFVAAVCVVFMIRAYKAGVAIGMDKTKMKRVISASATFTVLPSVGILLGVIASYVVAAATGNVDFSGVAQAAWFGLPVAGEDVPADTAGCRKSRQGR